MPESAAAHEELSWAAWWRDDAPAVFAERERAYALYRAAGDPHGAARMATWLACDELDFRGGVPVARGWLQRAARLLDGVAPAPEHGWLAFFEGYLAAKTGDAGQAAERADRTTEIGRLCGDGDLVMLGLALGGATDVSGGRVELGMRRLDEATATALEGSAVPIAGAWTFCFLVSACVTVLDYDRAAAWCDRIAEFAQRYGSRMMLGFCRAEYGEVQLWRGRWDEAEALLEASVEDFLRSRPAMVGGPLVALAELRRRQGRVQDANALLARAGESSGAQLCRARLALDRGDALEAAELSERVLRRLPELQRARGLELLVGARAAGGELEQGATALAELRTVERLAGTAPLAAYAALAEGRLATAGGDPERGRVRLEDAVDAFERCGAPFEAAQARLELARALTALGRAEAAGREAAAARERIQQLGGEPREPLPELTPREREVLALLAEGLTNRQLAERLVLSEHTVHRHVTSILRKLDLPSRTAAAALAVRSGL